MALEKQSQQSARYIGPITLVLQFQEVDELFH